MAVDKVLLRIEAKLDALLKEAKLDPAKFGGEAGKGTRRPAPKLTQAQQEAIDNAPKHVEARPIATQPTPPPPAPPEAVGQATVLTEQPDGKTTTQTKPVSAVGESSKSGKA